MLSSAEKEALTAARRGDRRTFSQLTEPYRAELQAHCYRMLGSLEDAEDVVQETFLRAWRSLDRYAGRGPFRAWLYKISTNASLDLINKRSRRSLPTRTHAPADPRKPFIPTSEGVLWLEPYPDVLIKGFASNPETIYSQYESIRLAFLVALQQLPPRQRAVLLLRDVLAWRAKEVAEHLEMTLPAVNSALHRARRSLREHYQHRDEAEIIQEFQIDHQTQMMLDQYVQAWETADVKLLVSLLKEEATFAMPPSPSWYQGRNAIQAFLSLTLFQEKPFQRWRLLPTRANAQPSFGLYEIEPSSGFYRPSAIQVVTIMGGQFSDITTFLNPDHFPRFNLPIELEN